MSKEQQYITSILKTFTEFPVRSIAPLHTTVSMFATDDCAVIAMNNGYDLAISTDFIRGPGYHMFKLGYMNWKDVGWYLIAANVSDLAAMGATPMGITINIRYSKDMTDQNVQDLIFGINEACIEFHTPLIGGDTGSYDSCVLTATALGTVPHGKALLRSAAQPEDEVYITGEIGLPGAALAYFLRGKAEGVELTPAEEDLLINSWRRIQPSWKQGMALMEYGVSRCAQDVSDGLKITCQQLAAASGLDIILYPDLLPIPNVVKKVAAQMKLNPIALACGDSVDFQLVFTCSYQQSQTMKNLFQQKQWRAYHIGHCKKLDNDKPPSAYITTFNDGIEEAPGEGWQQQDTLAVDDLRKT